MTSSTDSRGEAAPEFSPYRLDSHLVLNALNQLGMEAYRLVGEELLLVGLLADYIVAEHGSAYAVYKQPDDTPHTLQLEWEVCKSLLRLKASLSNVVLDFEEAGDLSAIPMPDHSIAELLRAIFVAWPNLAGCEIETRLDATDSQAIRIRSTLRSGIRSERLPFVSRAIASLRPSDRMKAFDVIAAYDDGVAWDLLLRARQPNLSPGKD